MTDEQIKDALTEEEKGLLSIINFLNNDHGNVIMNRREYPKIIKLFKSLAAERIENRDLREHIKKHEWASHSVNTKLPYCSECVRDKNEGHAKDCKTAALLKDES